jgi:hypothetical protein
MSATPTADDDIALIDAVTELRVRFGVALPYQTAWGLCVGGILPATRVRGRWYVRRADLPRVAALAGSRQPARAKPSERTPVAA